MLYMLFFGRKRTCQSATILFVAPRFHNNLHYWVSALCKRGHEVHFLVAGSSVPATLAVSEHAFEYASRYASETKAMEATERSLWLAKNGVPKLRPLWRLLQELRPDAIILRNPNFRSLGIAGVLGWLHGAKVVVYTQAKLHSEPRLLESFLRFAVRRFCRSWITPCLGDTALPARHGLIYVPFAQAVNDSAEERAYCPQGIVRILTVGKFYERKRFDLIVEALSCQRTNMNWALTIVGACKTESQDRLRQEIMKLAERKGLQNRISIETNLSLDAMAAKYLNSDLFVLPSENERASISQLEAMACGTAVVCADQNGTSCYIEPGINGYTFKEGSLSDLTRVLTMILSEPAALQRIGKECIETVRRKHSPEVILRSLEAAIN